MKVRLKGDRTPFHVGERFSIPVSESETITVEVYEVIKETGAGLARSVDGQKFRCYGYGWSNEELAKYGPTTVPLSADVERIFYRDEGFEYYDGGRKPL
jgi:hypothetical protein